MSSFDILKSLFGIMPPYVWWALGALAVLRILAAYLNSPKMKGRRGERRVAQNLARGLPKEYAVLNDIYLPLPDGGTTQIDHVVVSPFGIFAIETKNYSGWIFADAKAKVWTQTIYRRKSAFQNPMRQNYQHVCILADTLGVPRESVRGVVAFVGDCTFKTERPEGVVRARDIARYIRQFTERTLAPARVAEFAQTLLARQGTLPKEAKKAHVRNLAARHQGVSASAKPKCPRCGGEMVLRTSSSTGRRFFGCTSYPKCRGKVAVAE